MDDAISVPSAAVEVLHSAANGNGNAEASSSTPVVERPDAKTRRYDRQLRLWGASGQGGLEGARVLLINPTATGTQSLKNLVLPGIGYFEILSEKLTSPQDIGQNFFLMPGSLQKPLAEETTKFLRELNSGVAGEGKFADVAALLESDPSYFLDFTLIIAVNLPAAVEEKLSALLWTASDPTSSVTTPAGAHPDIPLILARSAGFVGLVRLQIREHTIVDTHPTSLVSLRLDQPFPALLAYANSINFETLDSMDHGNVPFVLIIIRALEEWRSSHDGKQPIWSGKLSQKKEFIASITKTRRHGDEENYAEAEEKAFLAAQVTKIPKDLQDLFSDPACENVTKNSKSFFLLLRALRTFVSTTSHLPVSASLPDMKSSTSAYVDLQSIYKAKAKEDLESIKICLAEVLKNVGLDEDAIDESEIEEFVKNAGGLKVFRGRSLGEERELDGEFNKETIMSFLPDPDWNVPYIPPPIVQYIAFRASDAFYALHSRYPGTPSTANLEKDTSIVEGFAEDLLVSQGWVKEDELPKAVKDAVGEIVRAGASDLPTTAAYLGGVVAQEAIKLLTEQYIPLNNTAVIDLIRGGTGAYEL
ncbi:hypothetical protein BDY24DRAFT_393087 [Mrakia frigida]|uniref:Ula1p n=1 Tax=Mrakia frigida TaxID=29902 RepID=UPI003FCBF890